jgi:hypothetical protein
MNKKQIIKIPSEKIEKMERQIKKLFYENFEYKRKEAQRSIDFLLLDDKLTDLEIKINYLGGNKWDY